MINAKGEKKVQAGMKKGMGKVATDWNCHNASRNWRAI